MVYRYLAEQVWNSLDERIAQLPAHRGVPAAPRDARSSVAAGFDDAAAIIESLRERVAFISVLDAGVYKLHDLFRDFVQRQVALEGDDALREAHVSAGASAESMGMAGRGARALHGARARRGEVERVLASTTSLCSTKAASTPSSARCARCRRRDFAREPEAARPARRARRSARPRRPSREVVRRRARARRRRLAFRVTGRTRYALLLYQQRAGSTRSRARRALRDRDDLGTPHAPTCSACLAMILRASRPPSTTRRPRSTEALELAEFGDDALRARTFSRAATIAFYAGDEEPSNRYTREGGAARDGDRRVRPRGALFTRSTSMHAIRGPHPGCGVVRGAGRNQRREGRRS